MALLELEAVTFAYGERTVLDRIDLHVDRGEFVAIVGPNGAGKSTLLRVASGLLAPARGHVRFDGEDLRGMSRREVARRVTGLAAEEPTPFPYSVRATVELGRHPWRGAFGGLAAADVACVQEAIDAVDLGELADRPLPRLSSGERQRAAIARCLAQGGELFLLDEPSAHLDLGHAQRMLSLLRDRTRADGTCVLAALHDLNLAAATADRLVLLVGGRIVAVGPPAEVLRADRVEEAFGASVHILAHPDHGSPLVVSRATRHVGEDR